MATDSNWFDDWLKHRLYRDILFTVALLQAVHLGAITSKNAIAIATMYLMFSVFLVITAILNVFVRRAEPSLTSIEPFSSILTKSWKVVLAYTLAICFVAFRVWLARRR